MTAISHVTHVLITKPHFLCAIYMRPACFCVLVSALPPESAHLMPRVSVPRLSQLAHSVAVNLADTFWYNNTVTSMRRDCQWDPFDSRASLLSPTDSSSDVDSEFDVETIPDDRTLVLVESGRHSFHSSSLPFSEVLEDVGYVQSQFTSQGPPRSSENPDESARRPIIYPLPTDEELSAYVPTPRDPTINASFAPPPPVPALRPSPSHYKRRRGRILSVEDYDPDPDQATIRYICVMNRLGRDGC